MALQRQVLVRRTLRFHAEEVRNPRTEESCRYPQTRLDLVMHPHRSHQRAIREFISGIQMRICLLHWQQGPQRKGSSLFQEEVFRAAMQMLGWLARSPREHVLVPAQLLEVRKHP